MSMSDVIRNIEAQAFKDAVGTDKHEDLLTIGYEKDKDKDLSVLMVFRKDDGIVNVFMGEEAEKIYGALTGRGGL